MTHCQMGVFGPQGKGRFGRGVELRASTRECKLQPNRQSYATTWRIQTRILVGLATAIPPFAKLLWSSFNSLKFILYIPSHRTYKISKKILNLRKKLKLVKFELSVDGWSSNLL